MPGGSGGVSLAAILGKYWIMRASLLVLLVKAEVGLGAARGLRVEAVVRAVVLDQIVAREALAT